MGYPENGFVGKTTKFAMTALATAIIMTVCSSVAHAKKVEAIDADSERVMSKTVAQQSDKDTGGNNKSKRRSKRNTQDLSISKDFKFYNQVAGLDLTDPLQADSLLQFMEICRAEKDLKEQVVLVHDPDEVNGADNSISNTTTSVERTIPVPESSAGSGKAGSGKAVAIFLKEDKDKDKETVINEDIQGNQASGKKDGVIPGSSQAESKTLPFDNGDACKKMLSNSQIARPEEAAHSHEHEREARGDQLTAKAKFEQLPDGDELTQIERGWIERAMERRKAREMARAQQQQIEDETFPEKEYRANRKTRSEDQKQETLRLAEEQRSKADEKAAAERQRQELLRLAEEKSKADVKAAEERKKQEFLRLAEEKRNVDEKVEAERKMKEFLRLAEEKRGADEKKAAAERKMQEFLRLTEEKRKADEKKAAAERKMQEFLRLAEEKRKADGKAAAEKPEAMRLAEEQQQEQQEQQEQYDVEKVEKVEKKDEKESITAVKVKGNQPDDKQEDNSVVKAENVSVKPSVVGILPSRPITYQVASSEEDPKINNFDQGITRRFKVAGSYLDRGENDNNIIKDNQGREFLNVMAFWDVLVEPLDNGENRYYGSIQFPLGSRHPAIIKNTRPGDALALGCQADEVVVLKAFETEGIDYQHGLIDAYLAHSVVMSDGTTAFQEVVRQPSFSLINVETGCMSRDIFSRIDVDPDRMGHDKILNALPVRE